MAESGDYRIFTSYSPNSTPEHPGEPWTRFVCISDTHSSLSAKLPPGDVLIHAGDLTSWGTLDKLQETIEWIKSLPYKLKVIIAGNHDWCLDSGCKSSQSKWGLPDAEVDAAQKLIRSNSMRDSGLIYLEHEAVDITTSNGTKWKIYGSPAAPLYVDGAFQYATKSEAKLEWSKIPSDVEILITHTPPFAIHDTTRHGKNAGCKFLADRIQQLSGLRLHVFGHIHEAHGASALVLGKNPETPLNTSSESMETIFVNAAYYHRSPPVIVDLKKVNKQHT